MKGRLGWGDPLGLTVAAAWMFALGLGPIYTLRNRIEPLPTGQFIDDARVNVAFVAIHLAVMVLLARRLPRLSRVSGALLVALHVLVIASALWSLAPGRSVTQGALFALTTAAALVVGDRIGIRGVLVAVAASSQAGVVLSQLVVRRGWPGTLDPNGDWTGLYLNRNSMGPVAVLALLATVTVTAMWAAEWVSAPGTRLGDGVARTRASAVGVVGSTVVVGLLVLDAHTLIKSASLTPMVGAAVAMASAFVAGGLPTLLRRRSGGNDEVVAPGVLAVGVLTTWVGIAVVALLGRSELAPSLDRSTTLSGRTELWGWLIDASSRRPFTGWGWLGVWEDKPLEADVVGRFGVDFSTAHNAVIEMLLAAGVLGAVLLVATVGALIWPTMQLAANRGANRWLGVIAVGLAGYVVAVNQLETYVGANLLPWALLVAVAAACGRQLVEGPKPALTDAAELAGVS